MTCTNPGLSQWEAEVVADTTGTWTYRVEGWSHPWATWVHDAAIKIPAGIDAELMRAEGALVLDRAAEDPTRDEGGRSPLRSVAEASPAPGLVIVAGPPDAPGEPLLADRPLVDGKAAAYVCRGFVCDRPVTDTDALSQALSREG